jgi:ADP-heptose:LPS heptosyltransferase
MSETAADQSTASTKRRNPLAMRIRIALARLVWSLWPASAAVGRPLGPVALIRWDGKIGDWVLSSHLFGAIGRATGSTMIAVAAPHQLDLYRETPGVDVVLPCRRKSLGDVVRTGLALRRLGCDTVVELTDRARWSDMLVMALSGARLRLKGVEPGIGSLFRLLDLPVDGHVVERGAAFLAAIGVPAGDWRFDWRLPADDRAAAAALWGDRPVTRILLNPFGADRTRILPAPTIAAIAERLIAARAEPTRVIVPLPPSVPGDWRAAVARWPVETQPVPVARIEATAALIAGADLVISPDTSIVHIAALFDRPMVALYPEDTRETRRWRPRSTRATILVPTEAEAASGLRGITAIDPGRIVEAARERLTIAASEA